MWSLRFCVVLFLYSWSTFTFATILQNGQVRETDYPNTVVIPTDYNWNTYQANASELSYKGRWDSEHISWWSAPGLKFAFTGEEVAITFGPWTSNGVLVGYRINGQDWQFTNITTNATHLLVSPTTEGVNLDYPISPSTFELRVTNFAYGVQIQSVHVAVNASIIKIPDFSRTIEVIGDSLSAGYSATYEGLASFAYNMAAGLGDTEYSITAYPGICLYDQNCWGNPRGQTYQWYHTSDTSSRAYELYGDNPPLWDFAKHPAADIVLINLGTNDNNTVNNVSSQAYYDSYLQLIEGVHNVWPQSKVVIMSLWNGFYQLGNTYKQSPAYVDEIFDVYKYFNSPLYLNSPIKCPSNATYTCKNQPPPKAPFVYYFNTTGILQHNDIDPQYHPTDVGHIKVGSHLMQFVKDHFDWYFQSTGPEIQHDTLYWNDMVSY